MTKKLQVMDLFAGAGGLSNGFEQTGKFEVKIAVEINENARKTYLKNHPHVKEKNFHKDITTLIYKNENDTLKEEYQNIDVIIGGPPCQGFSNANRQKNTLISSNNQLVKEYLRAVEEIMPKAFVLENVRTLASDKHKFFVGEDDEIELANLEIVPDNENITVGFLKRDSDNLLLFLKNVYQNNEELRPYLINKEVFSKLNSLFRLVKKESKSELIEFMNKENNKRFYSKIVKDKWEDIHHEWDNKYKEAWNLLGKGLVKVLENNKFNIKELNNSLEEIIETQRILNKINEIIQNKIKLFEIKADGNNLEIQIKSYNIFSYIKAKLSKLGYKFNEDNYIFNTAQYGVPQERRRLILIGVYRDYLKTEKVITPEKLFESKKDYNKIFDAIGDLEQLEPNTNVSDDEMYRGEVKPLLGNPLNKYLNDNKNNIVFNHVRTESREMALKRFKSLKEGQNFHDLDESLKSTYTDYSRTQNTIYKRLNYELPSDTVVNVRKSMWIHPKKDRAISIREAARLQSFQDSYRFYGTKDSQYQQVGNAVPPLMARSVAESLLESLGQNVAEKVTDIIKPQNEKLTSTVI